MGHRQWSPLPTELARIVMRGKSGTLHVILACRISVQVLARSVHHSTYPDLANLSLAKMAAVSQTIFSDVFL